MQNTVPAGSATASAARSSPGETETPAHWAGGAHAAVVAVMETGGETLPAPSTATTANVYEAPHWSAPTVRLVSAVRAIWTPSWETRYSATRTLSVAASQVRPRPVRD